MVLYSGSMFPFLLLCKEVQIVRTLSMEYLLIFLWIHDIMPYFELQKIGRKLKKKLKNGTLYNAYFGHYRESIWFCITPLFPWHVASWLIKIICTIKYSSFAAFGVICQWRCTLPIWTFTNKWHDECLISRWNDQETEYCHLYDLHPPKLSKSLQKLVDIKFFSIWVVVTRSQRHCVSRAQ